MHLYVYLIWICFLYNHTLLTLDASDPLLSKTQKLSPPPPPFAFLTSPSLYFSNSSLSPPVSGSFPSTCLLNVGISQSPFPWRILSSPLPSLWSHLSVRDS